MTSNARIFMANIEMSEWDLTKRDVHQLGVLLLELITGEDPLNNSGFYQSLEGQGCDREVLYFLKVACNCIQPVPDRRPTMVELFRHPQMALDAKLALLLIHILSVAGNGVET
ncbi:probable inactive receptor kinase At1g27190 [Populus alba]|uniref:probable inactive receptor kinase At1g27190 n=1 Tax=Populus alba TaxID=43335 RepID=UPI003CC766A6